MKNRSTFITLLIVAITTLLLNSCSRNTRKALGLEHSSPDESNVSQRPSLSIPPDFNLLPPQEDEQPTKEKKLTTQSSKSKKLNSTTSTKALKNKTLTISDQKFINKFSKAKKKRTSDQKFINKFSKAGKKRTSKVS